jgi:hypothetical protein
VAGQRSMNGDPPQIVIHVKLDSRLRQKVRALWTLRLTLPQPGP